VFHIESAATRTVTSMFALMVIPLFDL
jgi:hypothetical protein